ncbi:SDR family NAD(P)-dependent oxidoreductase [Lederbergia sp. NSJ-179]|uniref:SDR family NAD(P)-dependent oxidoreductase n=1 Tax=Lederbergia sp. NSJ-179 TaxID=2931402 RepID=UPI002458BDFB|nr:SDR family NAD(P)-dependent oxidoreductase [Lederbergia sp. NSJ-179]
MHNKPVALVTGANKGIGFQISKDLAAHGFTVLIGSRNFEKGKKAAISVGQMHGPSSLMLPISILSTQQ